MFAVNMKTIYKQYFKGSEGWQDFYNTNFRYITFHPEPKAIN